MLASMGQVCTLTCAVFPHAQLQPILRLHNAPAPGQAVQSACRMCGGRRARQCGALSAAAPQAEASPLAAPIASGDVLLEVNDLFARVAGGEQREILQGVSLTLRAGETHAIMGTNGSGKSTLSKALVGHPDYEVTAGSVSFKGGDLLELDPEDRARAGLFMSFQSPVEVPGVSNIDFLRAASNACRKRRGEAELDPLEFYGFLSPKLEALKMDSAFLNRNVNEGFSGGEKKRNEILQLAVLEADVAILDEIDSGLDIDALREVANAVNGLKSDRTATLMVTHYKRLLNYIKPDFVHVMEAGKIIYTGDIGVADVLEADGYEGIRRLIADQQQQQQQH